MIKGFLVWVTTVTLLISSEVVNKTTGSLELLLSNTSGNYSKVSELTINNDTYYNNNKFVVSVSSEFTEGTFYNSNVKSDVGDSSILRFNELYYTRYLDYDISLSVGLFPFTKGRFYEYGYNGNRAGIGTYTLTDAPMQGYIVTKTLDKHKFQYGDVAYEKYFNSYKDYDKGDGPITLRSHKDSSFKFISYSYEDSSWYFNNTVGRSEQHLNGRKLINTNTFTWSLSYNDDIESGRTYYGIYTRSFSHGDTTDLIPRPRHLDPSGPFDVNGYFYLLGVKQELDAVLFGKDVVLGFEYMHRSKGYHSILSGKPLSVDAYSDIGDIYNTFVGVRLDKDKILKFRYYKYASDRYVTKDIITPAYTDEYVNDSSYDSYVIELYIDF